MKDVTKYQITVPVLDDPPNIPAHLEGMAFDIEAALDSVIANNLKQLTGTSVIAEVAGSGWQIQSAHAMLVGNFAIVNILAARTGAAIPINTTTGNISDSVMGKLTANVVPPSTVNYLSLVCGMSNNITTAQIAVNGLGTLAGPGTEGEIRLCAVSPWNGNVAVGQVVHVTGAWLRNVA